jgi:FtsZ-interacting cell division protein YlmF
MSILKRKEDAPDVKEEGERMSKEEVQELVYDIEGTKNAIQTCITFEKATGIQLISKQGRVEFSRLYQKEEKKNRVKEMIRDEVQQQITPLNKKLDKIIDVITTHQKDTPLKKPTDYAEARKCADEIIDEL